jgi:hypothetical protein
VMIENDFVSRISLQEMWKMSRWIPMKWYFFVSPWNHYHSHSCMIDSSWSVDCTLKWEMIRNVPLPMQKGITVHPDRGPHYSFCFCQSNSTNSPGVHRNDDRPTWTHP